MGNFYTNYTLRGPSQLEVAAALEGRLAVVTPQIRGSLVVFDEASDDQDQEEIAKVGAWLSSEFQCPILTVLNHDDDVLWCQLHEVGQLTDEYDSSPGYFDPHARESLPKGGNAERLAAAFGAKDAAAVEQVLRKPSHDRAGYMFAFQRHAALVNALDLPDYAVSTSYISFDRDEYPAGLTPDDIERTS